MKRTRADFDQSDASASYNISQRRRSLKSRRPSKKRSKKTKALTRKDVRKEILKIAEKKFINGTNSAGIDFSGTVTSISDVAQGDTDNTRDGDNLYLTSLQLRWSVVLGDSTNLARIIVFQWKPNSTPTTGDILITTGSTAAPLSAYNHDTRQSYRILSDSLVALNAAETMKAGTSFVVNFPVKQIQYTGSGTTGTNKLYLLALSDSGASSHPTFTYYYKLNYRDA